MKRKERTWIVAVLVSALGSPSVAQQTVRVSVDSSGNQSNDVSNLPEISADGQFVVFESNANNLVVGDTNGFPDIFVHDRLSGTTKLLSVASSGLQSNEQSYYAAISGDGRFVAFTSLATNLVPGDTNDTSDIFVHDCVLATTVRVSVDSAGVQADDESAMPSLSFDGRIVAFVSFATNLVAGDTNQVLDTFVHDMGTGVTTRVSVDSFGNQGNDHCLYPSISDAGDRVGFWSGASNLVTGDGNGVADIFVHDRNTATTVRASVSSAGVEGDQATEFPAALSRNGRCIAFPSHATNMVAGDLNGTLDVFVHDLQSGWTARASVGADGAEGDKGSMDPSISADGRYVGFTSFATNLVDADTNHVHDVFVRDLLSGVTRRASLSSSGGQANQVSESISLSADGRFAAFWSRASDLVSGDTNSESDIFVHGCESTGSGYCSVSVNSTGAPAEISACCSSSSASGALVITALPVPDQFGLFLHASDQTEVLFGNGYLCITGDLQRGALLRASDHVGSYRYDNSDVHHSLAAYVGATRHFQYWFRDPMGGGALFNTSNAISITVVP